MPSLIHIVSSIASRVGKPFDVDLQEELKHIVGYKRANYTQQFLEKHPDQRGLFLQKVTLELEKAPKDDCESVEGCEIMRTKCEVPTPIRTSGAYFNFVGDSNFMNGYIKQDPAYVQDSSANRFTAKKPSWFYMNKRIYIYNSTVVKRIGVRGVFEDPTAINSCACADTPCFDENGEYPMAGDLLNPIVRDILSVELRQMLPSQPDVELDEPEEILDRGVNLKGNR